MGHRLKMLTAVASLGSALVLAACDNSEVEPVEQPPLGAEADTLVVVDFDPLSRDYTLTPEQRTARDAFDMEGMQAEYAGYRDSMSADSAGQSVDAGQSGTTSSATSTESASTEQSSMPERSEMDWSFLDRNSDDQLSVAEYAIWAVPVDPTEPKSNDETRPYLTSDQANKAADSFFYYDQNGDTYLSQDEFEAARRGDTLS